MIKRTTPFSFILYISIVLYSFSSLQAQSLQRETMSSTGNYSLINNTLIRQTIGQPYGTTTNYNNGILYFPGFQQPVISTTVIKSDLTLKLFPNPAANYVNIESASTIDNVSLSLVDNLGKLLFTKKVDHFRSYLIDCSNFSTGVYIITVTTVNNQTFSAKLIINR